MSVSKERIQRCLAGNVASYCAAHLSRLAAAAYRSDEPTKAACEVPSEIHRIGIPMSPILKGLVKSCRDSCEKSWYAYKRGNIAELQLATRERDNSRQRLFKVVDELAPSIPMGGEDQR